MQLATQEWWLPFAVVCRFDWETASCCLTHQRDVFAGHVVLCRRWVGCGWEDGMIEEKTRLWRCPQGRYCTEPHDLMADDEMRGQWYILYLRDLIEPPIKPAAAAAALSAVSCARFRSDAGDQEADRYQSRHPATPHIYSICRVLYHQAAAKRNPPSAELPPAQYYYLGRRRVLSKRASPACRIESIESAVRALLQPYLSHKRHHTTTALS
jgi:hypothetical protein